MTGLGRISVAWLLALLCAAAAALARFGPRQAAFCAALIWLLPVVFATDLKRPRGFGAWTLWAAWSGAAAFFCGEPLIAAAALWPAATGVLLFALAYSWWGRPHRRAWLFGVWTIAAAAGLFSAAAGAGGPGAAGFLLAGFASSAAAGFSREAEQNPWRGQARLAALFFLALGAFVFWKSRWSMAEVFARRAVFWPAAVAAAAARPWSGVGPGLLALGAAPPAQWPLAAAETGLTGLALFLTALAFSRPRFLRASARGSSREWERRAAAGAFWALALFSFLTTIFDRPALTYLWFTALACAAPGAEEEEARSFRLGRGAALAGAVFCLTAGAPSLYVRHALASGAPAQLRRAVELAPKSGAVAAAAAEAELRESPPQTGAALSRLQDAAREDPSAAAYPRRQAAIMRSIGAEEEAARFEALAREAEVHAR